MTRGEIWWADFGIPFGSEPGFRRPVLIIQDDSFNKSKINTIVVVPLTTNLVLEDAPGNVLLEKEESGLSKDSVIVVSQIGVLDRKRFIEKSTKVSKGIIEEVEYGIKLVLGIK
jgi:mRNA interferase MazF